MVENVQCPVCTLFLHAGMNLSDHLETHPKEQVIKALVQLTITGGKIGGALSLDLADEKKPDTESISKVARDREHELSTNSTSNSSSSLPSNSSSINSLNLSFCSIPKQPNSTSTTLATTGKHIFNQQNVTSSPAYQKSGGGSNTNSSISEVSHMPTDFSSFANRHQQSQPPSSQLHNQQHTHVAAPNQNPPPSSQQVPQLSSSTAHGFHSISQQQTPLLAHQHQNHTTAHQQLQNRPQHQLSVSQQQNLKIIYSSTLPPPPPLQLFTYQPPSQPQHQKPPPAYGTAISQIRSQHNQNKQSINQQLHRTTAVTTTTAPTLTATTAVALTSAASTSVGLSAVASSSKQLIAKPNVIPENQSTIHQKQYQPHQQTETLHQSPSQFSKTGVANTSSSLQKSGTYQPRAQPPPSPSSAAAASSRQSSSPYPTILSAAMASPSSSSSVLRYAESPVTAHYLERDNGDFIVQETPKHIVECVEKDNGEFSVIERIYQSPPSVLHIHDDDDEDDTKEVSNEETGKINIEKQKSEEIPDEEEFMSVDGDSDLEETTSEKSLPGVSGKLSKDNFNSKLTLEAPTTSTSIQKGTSLTSTTTTSNTSSNNSSNNSNNTTRKKSSKNTITVLSDVQLNLNEYLDLVGNIIASSKIAQNRKTFSAAAPIPLLKVEKVEPLDDYEAFEQFESIEDKSSKNSETEATCLPEPPSTTNNKNTETDELVANNHSNKFTLQPSPLEKTANESNLNEENVATKYPSHATSVIRMATTTSQQQLLEAEELSVEENVENLENVNGSEEKLGKDAIVVEDLSHIKTEITIEATQLQPIVIPPLKRGPKKLVIKPKSTKTDNNRSTVPTKTVSEVLCDETPTTSAKAQKQLNEKGRELHSEEKTKQQIDIPSKNVIIKSEPNVGVESRILEQHLKTSGPLLELKKEKSSSRVELNSQEESQKFNIKYESDEFVYVPKTSKEPREGPARITMQNVAEDARVLLEFANSKKTTIASSNAMTFPSSNSIFAGSSIEKSNSANATCSSSSSSTTASTSVASSNALATLRCDDEFIVPDASEVVQEIVISSTYSSQSASDAALNNCNEVSQPHHQNNFSDYPFSFLYGGGSVAQQIETKGNFSPIYQQQPHDATTAATLASGSNSTTIEEFSSVHNHQNQQRYHSAPAGAAQWYHAVSTSNTDFEAALAVDCSGTEGDVGKYLDLDSCKRANMTGSQAAPSSTSSSFTAATESSLPGCTTDALNIRTDEKMPAKGEISEQESNCDIENSWSQPMYGDIPARFFKTSFPGLFPQENGWNNEEYFTVHDLSASAGAVNGTNNRTTKSFDFRLPLESSSTSTAPAGILHQNQQHIDTLPSTSKKKRKRDLNADKSPTTTRAIAATVTSQELLQQPQQQQQLLHIYHQQPTTSAAVLAGPSTAAAASQAAASSFNITIQKQRKKVYQCVHCPAEFSKLKDRNSHMIVKHNYVRQNRRLICVQTGATTDTTSVVDLAAPSGSNILTMPQHNGESVEDSKHGIVKIELDSSEQALTAITNASPDENITAKSELMDEKESLALVPTSSSSAVVDSKPLNIRPLSLTHATKLATLYRMLVSFNISTLKQNQNFSETDVKLMESSIFFCYICRQNFSTVKLYDAHLTEHPAECFTCGKKFNRWKNFSLHLKRHLGWKEFGCNVCDKKFVVRSALVEHMRMHTGQTPLKCKICGKHFKRYSNLTQHRKRHGKQIIRKKEFVCHCGEVLPSKARFLWHKETHDAKPKCCPYCCDRFVHANSLRRHIRLAHSDKFDYTEPMECPMCKQVFAKSSIRAHMATHSMDTQHDCPICNKSFSTKWNLKIHSWVHANRTAKPFKCEHCPKAFVREVDFKNHMNAHKQIKPYTCEYCGCKFIRKYNYMRHRREHHGNKKFTCDLCKKSFHRHYYLIEHRRIHTGERPFQCTICGKSSTTKTNHNKHLKIHHSRDPFTVEA